MARGGLFLALAVAPLLALAGCASGPEVWVLSDPSAKFNATLADKMRVTTTPEPIMAPGDCGDRRGFDQPWPMYTKITDVTQYEQGTLTIGVVDTAHKQLVWEGTVTNGVTSKDMNDVGAALDRAVTSALTKFLR